MEWTGMLVVSLRGVNFGFRLGCSGLVNSCTQRNNKTERIVVLLGVKFKISAEHPRSLHMGVPPPPRARRQRIWKVTKRDLVVERTRHHCACLVSSYRECFANYKHISYFFNKYPFSLYLYNCIYDSSNWMSSFGSLNLSKLWNCRSFSDFKSSFSHSEDFICIL